jgi:thiamine-phosphate pyrophosphorylase
MKPPAPWPQRGLYLITPDEADTDRLLARVRPALAAGPALLQYRNKGADASLRREQARELLAACRSAGLPLVINDDWRLAAELGADGAHLGSEDGSVAEARATLGPAALLGASCYDRLDLAERAAADGASYLAFGAFFPSATKPAANRAEPGLLKASAHLNLPRVAIGGITPDNAGIVIAAGADLVAVISGVFDSPDPAASVRAYRRCFDHPSLSTPSE